MCKEINASEHFDPSLLYFEAQKNLMKAIYIPLGS